MADTSPQRLGQQDFARLLMQTQPRVTLYVRAMVFNASDVDDIVQNVAAKACERLDTFDASRSFEAWIITIARYEVLAYFQRCKRDRLVFDDGLAKRMAQTLEGMSSRGEMFTFDALERCLARLRPDDRELLRRRFESGQRGIEIAAVLKVSVATISRRFARVYSQLLVCIRAAVREEAAR